MSLIISVVIIIITLCFLLCESVQAQNCEPQLCTYPQEILNSFKNSPENRCQLLKAFYPFNKAKPSSVIIAYFTNYTDPLPQECEQGTYPWKTYPGINPAQHTISWYMWTTTPIFSIQSEMLYLEFGSYLPILSYYLVFNKTSPFLPSTTIACIKTPLVIDTKDTAVMGDVTIQVSAMHI